LKVLVPSALRSYTGQGPVEAHGATLAEILFDLERRYPGIRFRMIDEQGDIRPHIRFFANGEQIRNLSWQFAAVDELIIVQALSGG